MSTSKRKHSSPPPASSSPKKRKHKYKSSSHTKSSHVESSASSTATSLFQKSRLKIHTAVPPAAVESLDTYLQSHLTSTLLLKHTAEGTIVAFSGFKSLDGAGRVLDECPFAWSWFEGDVVLFNPRIGQRIRGTVTLSSPDHIALITHALFNISVPRTELPEDWTYNDESWVDAEGNKIEGELDVEVIQLITSSSILSMLGSLKYLGEE